MVASASFCFDDGMRTSSCIATLPLRMRVSMSAMGSVIVIAASTPSPRCLRDAGNFAGVRHLAQADPAQAELAVHGARTTTTTAARVAPNLELGLALRLHDERLLRHYCCTPSRRKG